MNMYDSYNFFSAPNYSNFDNDTKKFEDMLYSILSDDRDAFKSGQNVTAEAALARLKK